MERFNCFDRFSCLDTSDSNTYRYKNDPDGQASQIHKLYELLQNLNAEITGNKAKTGYFCLSWIGKHCHNYWWSYRDVTRKYYQKDYWTNRKIKKINKKIMEWNKHHKHHKNKKVCPKRLYWIQSNNLTDLINLVYKYPYKNWYIAPNTFKTKNRSKIRYYKNTKINRAKNRVNQPYNNMNTILAFYLDFDVVETFKDKTRLRFYYPNGHLRKIMGTRTMMIPFGRELPDILAYCGFQDNVIINSGNGYHALILLKHGIYCGSDKISNYWHEIEEAMVSKVTKRCQHVFGKKIVDPSVSNINRILRVAGGLHMKHMAWKPRAKYWVNTKTKVHEYPRPVKLLYFNPDDRPDFWSLFSFWVFGHTCYHYDKAKIARKRKSVKRSKSVKIKRNHHKEQQYRGYQTRKHNKTGHNTRTLNYNRCLDIWQHVKNERARHETGEGHRDYTIYWYMDSNVFIWKSDHKVARNMIALNNNFIKPLKPSHMATLIKEIPHARVMVHKPNAHMYHPKNSTIISYLNITQQEQKHMRTLIDSTERQKRYRQRLLNRKQSRRSKQDELNIKMFRLHEAGKSYQVIADTFGKSRSTAIRRVRLGKSASVKYRSLNVFTSSHYDSVKESKHNVSVNHSESDVDVSDLHNPNDPIYKQELKLNQILKFKRKRMLGDG